jgi:hypothetical protein
MSTVEFVTAIIAGAVNIACLCVSFFLDDKALVTLIQQIGNGVTIMAVAVVTYIGGRRRADERRLVRKLKGGA